MPTILKDNVCINIPRMFSVYLDQSKGKHERNQVNANTISILVKIDYIH